MYAGNKVIHQIANILMSSLYPSLAASGFSPILQDKQVRSKKTRIPNALLFKYLHYQDSVRLRGFQHKRMPNVIWNPGTVKTPNNVTFW